MLSVIDPDGRRTGRQAVVQTALLLPASILPFVLGLAGPVYACGAGFSGLCFFWFALQFARSRALSRARQLFYFSLIHLPVLLTLMVMDKI